MAFSGFMIDTGGHSEDFLIMYRLHSFLGCKLDGSVKSPRTVIPAKAGISSRLVLLDSRLRGNDNPRNSRLFTGSSNSIKKSFISRMVDGYGVIHKRKKK